jgi:hypothetical protein
MRRDSIVSLAVALWVYAVANSNPVLATPIEEALQRVDISLARVQHLNHTDLLSEEGGARYLKARKFVREKQCDSGTANPLVMTSFPITASLKGTFADNGSVSISGVTVNRTERPITAGSGRFIEIPLRIASLADIPQEYLKEMASLAETRGLPDEVANRLRTELPQNHARLTARVQTLMSDFDPAFCPGPTARRFQAERYHYIIFVPPTF